MPILLVLKHLNNSQIGYSVNIKEFSSTQNTGTKENKRVK